MPVPKIEAVDSMKSNDGNGSIDNFIRQTIGKEPYLSFSRVNDSPVHWNQLLYALDQQAYLPGWPLPMLSPMKIEMLKCDKCSREFCSTISYRRHRRLHRRKLNLDKDSAAKSRCMLQAFWDKLSVAESMDVMSLDDVSLEGLTGSSIITALTSFIRKPGYTSLPHSYVKSGSVLLDIVQGRPTRFPILSQELFNILDEASENTFLCAGTAESLKKFVFNGDAETIGLEMRNLVACTSFLVEQKLVKACLADKDAESLRYQKLLVDEEEAAHKRQAALMEKKRQKKLRQKEQRERELAFAENDDSPEESLPSPSSSIPSNDYDSNLEVLEILPDATPALEHSQLVLVGRDNFEDQENRHPEIGYQQKGGRDLGAYQNFEHKRLHHEGQRQAINSHLQAPKSHRYSNGFHTNHNYQSPKPVAAIQKRASSRNSHVTTNGFKVWTAKPKSETDERSTKPKILIEAPKVPCQERKVLIGSISVSLGRSSIQGQDGILWSASESCASEHSVPSENRDTANNSAVMLWRPVNRRDGGQLPIDNGSGTAIVDSFLLNDSGGVKPTTFLLNDSGGVKPTTFIVESTSGCEDKSDSCVEGGHKGGLKFSSHLAEAFLSQRWKEAITADHVELILLPEGPPGHSVVQDNTSNVLGCTENDLPVRVTIDSSTTVKTKARAKPQKGSKVKYIQKQTSDF
ncbi:hypothetical protein KSS87_021678 [Heliosperma pusillum]|nr:hypothetical protein KSS87_021678 [Heliosperma pusillum]